MGLLCARSVAVGVVEGLHVDAVADQERPAGLAEGVGRAVEVPASWRCSGDAPSQAVADRVHRV